MRLKPSAAFLAVIGLLASHLAFSSEIAADTLSQVEVISSKIASPLNSSPAINQTGQRQLFLKTIYAP